MNLLNALAAGFLACVAVAGPAGAVVNIDFAQLRWRNTVTPPFYETAVFNLTPGANTFSKEQYALTCHEEDCDRYRFGGAILRSNWTIDLQPDGVTYDFESFQGADGGGGTVQEFDTEILFSSSRRFTIETLEHTSVTSVICGNCQSHLRSSAGVWEAGGVWYAEIFIFGDGSVSNGDHTLAHRYEARITEVPEPAAWALMVLGLGGVGGALRSVGRARRRVSVTVH